MLRHKRLKRGPMKRGTKGLHARKSADQKVRTLRRRRSLASSVPRVDSRRDYERSLGRLNPQIVKIRDGFECRQCLLDGVRRSEILDSGHLYPRSSFPAGRFLLENLMTQCRFHNLLHMRQPAFMFNAYLLTHTQEELEALHARCTGPSPTTEQLGQWVVERTALLEQMRLDAEVAA